jgi:hypothetical protein
MGYKKISTQYDIEIILNCFYWEDAFLREMYVLNPGFFTKNKMHAYPDANPNIGMVLLTCDEKFSGLEIILNDVSSISINFSHIIKPVLILNDQIQLSFNNGENKIQAKEMFYRHMDEDEIIGDRIKSSDYWYFHITDLE